MLIEPNSNVRPAIGTVVTRPKELVTHSGIYMGQNWVFENVPGGARFSSWHEFSKGHPVTTCQTLSIAEGELWRRAQAVVNARRNYGLVDFNCDDAVNIVAEELVRPSQFIGLAMFALLAWGAVSLFSGNA